MARRRQAKQAAAESVQAAADGNVTPPKKRKAAAKSTAPKPAKTALPRQVRQVREQEAATAFSPKKLRSRLKEPINVATKSETESKSKKLVNKQKEEETAEDNNVGEQVVEKKTRGGGKSAVTKKAGKVTTTAKPKAKVSVVRKKKADVENGVEDVVNRQGTDRDGIKMQTEVVPRRQARQAAAESTQVAADGDVSEENPPKRTRRGKTDEENVRPAKVRTIRKPRKRKTAETEAIAEADDEPREQDDAEVIVDKKSRAKAKKTANNKKTTIKKEKSKKNFTKAELPLSEKTGTEEQNGQDTEIEESKPKNSKKGSVKKAISEAKGNAEKEIKEEHISMNSTLETVDENDAVEESNNVSYIENNEAELTIEMKDDQENIKDLSNFERTATFLPLE